MIQKAVIARVLVSVEFGEVFQEHAYRGELHHKLLYTITFDWLIVLIAKSYSQVKICIVTHLDFIEVSVTDWRINYNSKSQ